MNIILRGKCMYDDLDLMKVQIEVHYKYGNSTVIVYRKTIKGVENTFDFLFKMNQTHKSCRECSILFENEKNDSAVCKDCKFFEFLSKSKNESEICSICQESVHRFVLECGHSFHLGCLAGMEKQNAKCPNCRMKLSNSVIQRVYGNDYLDYEDSDDEDSD